jgi:hypothetical protein
MKQEIKTPLLVTVVVLVVVVVGYFGFQKIGSTGGLDQGQIKYTPGKPPWEETDPSKQGPGGVPGGGGFSGSSASAPAGNAPPANAPPGLSAPTLGNGGR